MSDPTKGSDGSTAEQRYPADEQQPIDADAEYRALSEREDGTNTG
jgi:hypothetical protein